MENSKYYTPEIEEFCVGFEYERSDGGEWYRSTSDSYDMMAVHTMLNKYNLFKITSSSSDYDDFVEKTGRILPTSLPFEKIKNNPNAVIFHERIRVKYLDKSDIESLGWRFLEEKEDFEAFENLEPNTDSTLVYRNNGNILHVFLNRNLVFAGRCKNKSELKKLMKQLNIVRWI